MPSEDEIIRNFEKETHTFIDTEKQIKKEDKEKERDLGDKNRQGMISLPIMQK